MNNTKRMALLNSFSSSGIYAIKMIVTLFTRAVFIQQLGMSLLGVQGVFTNVLAMVSLAELGVGSSLSLVLYKPLVNRDAETITKLMTFFKRVYLVISAVVLLLGIVALPLLPFLGKGLELSAVGTYYLLFLANTVVSYLFTYKRTLLNANQFGYISTLNDFFVWLFVQILQVIVLLLFQNFYIYLIIQILGTVISNLNISRIVSKRFPDYVKKNGETISKELKDDIKRNTVGSLSAKLGQIVINSTDNILISMFSGLKMVAIYSNYSVIIASGIQALLIQALYSITPSIGYFVNTKSEQDQVGLYKTVLHYAMLFLTLTVPGVLLVATDFIKLWTGSQFVLPQLTLLVMVMNFIVAVIRVATQSFINAKGLAWFARKRPIVESLSNLIISLGLVTIGNLGVSGIVLGTLVSSLFVGLIYEVHILFKYGFSERVVLPIGYIVKIFLILAFIVMTSFLTNVLLTVLPNLWLDTTVRVLVSLVISAFFGVTNLSREQKLQVIRLISFSKRKE